MLKNAELQEHINMLTQGAYDLHVHPAPSHVHRIVDDIELYQQAAEKKMGGIVLKCHYEPTGARAQLVNKHYGNGSTKAIGAITLNWPVGGLNPYAIESACRLGAKYIWMPTRDAWHSLEYGNMIGDFFDRPGIKVTDDNDKLLPQVCEILEIARENGVPVATGHISLNEAIVLCKEGTKMGAHMILTHPEWSRTKVPLDIQISLAKAGTWIEKLWLNIAEKDSTEEYLFHTIREIGPEHIILGTDCGKDVSDHEKTALPFPTDAYQDMIGMLISNGFSDTEIRTMSTENAKRIIRNL